MGAMKLPACTLSWKVALHVDPSIKYCRNKFVNTRTIASASQVPCNLRDHTEIKLQASRSSHGSDWVIHQMTTQVLSLPTKPLRDEGYCSWKLSLTQKPHLLFARWIYLWQSLAPITRCGCAADASHASWNWPCVCLEIWVQVRHDHSRLEAHFILQTLSILLVLRFCSFSVSWNVARDWFIIRHF